MVSWNEDYDVIISVHDASTKFYHVTIMLLVWSCDQNLITLAFLWEKNLNFIRIWPEKTLYLTGGLGSSWIIWDWELISMFVGVTGEKLVRGHFCFPLPPSWKGSRLLIVSLVLSVTTYWLCKNLLTKKLFTFDNVILTLKTKMHVQTFHFSDCSHSISSLETKLFKNLYENNGSEK